MPYHCNIPVNASINDWIPHKTHDSDPANYESNGIIYSSCDMFSTNKTVVPCSNGWYYVRREESIIAEALNTTKFKRRKRIINGIIRKGLSS
ncbi:unnamed protein product [Gordionus sp. m RMFG-2023]